MLIIVSKIIYVKVMRKRNINYINKYPQKNDESVQSEKKFFFFLKRKLHLIWNGAASRASWASPSALAAAAVVPLPLHVADGAVLTSVS